ncbi:MAG: LURP-one-related family protein, partial [Candidatus Thermoplasmatota archaeon]|nr:LURP-one-related family protein [Candidatus Thermoplasmatota archaeon]
KIEGKAISLRPTYRILDQSGNEIATMRKKLISFMGSQYWFEDPNGKEILRAKGNFLEYEYHLMDQSGAIVANISKKFLSIRDSYIVDITGLDVNKYLVLAAVVCIDACEHEDESKR